MSTTTAGPARSSTCEPSSPGAVIVVQDANGAQRRFVVQGRTEIAKPDLPVSELFTRTGPPALVLVTCGGSFDRSARSYAANVIVYAVPA